MNNTVVIISTIVDPTIKDVQRDKDFLLFNSLTNFMAYIEGHPIRAKSLYITQDVINRPTNDLTIVYNLKKNPFFTVDETIIILDKDTDTKVYKYLVEENKVDWKIVSGALTRDYIYGIIDGSNRLSEVEIQHKVMYRVPRSDYVVDKLTPGSDSTYLDDTSKLAVVENVYVPEVAISDQTKVADIIRIAGLPNKEHYLFAFLAAQYLSLSGKTILIDNDTKYHALSDIVAKSDINCTQIAIEKVLSLSAEDIVKEIRQSPNNLIILTVTERIEYDYDFLFNILWAQLKYVADYFIKTSNVDEMIQGNKYIITIPTDLPGILKTVDRIKESSTGDSIFVGVNIATIAEIHLKNSKGLSAILNDILNTDSVKSFIVNINSLKIGGENCGLHSIFGTYKQ